MNKKYKFNILIIILLLVSILVTGCNNKEEKTKSNDTYAEKISELKEFKNLDIINDNTLETILGINKNYVKSYAIGINKYNHEKMFAVIKPTKGQEDTIKLAMKLYIDAGKEQYKDQKFDKKEINYKKLYKNNFYKEYRGYQVYIISENNDKNFKEIKKIVR